MGTMMQPVEPVGGGDGAEPYHKGGARAQRGKQKGAVGTDDGTLSGAAETYEGYDEDDLLGSYHLATDEEIFGSQPGVMAGLAGSALKVSAQQGFLGGMSKSDGGGGGGSPSTPTVAYGPMSMSLGAGGEGGGGFSTALSRGRSLLSSMGAVAPMADLGDDEVFAEVPDHFDFDLDDTEVSEWREVNE